MKLKKMFGALLLSATLLIVGTTAISADTLDSSRLENPEFVKLDDRSLLGTCPGCGYKKAECNMIYGNWNIVSYQWHGNHQDVIYERMVREIIHCPSCAYHNEKTFFQNKNSCPVA